MSSKTSNSSIERSDGRGQLAWSILWALLAVLHVTQGIWLSGGAAYPGDLSDGRLNQLILEHGYQALRGVYAWSSPGQFFPVQHTLGYSDTHFGTLPLYALVRFLGASMEHAWQAWFVLVAALNAFAAFRLLRVLGVSTMIRGPGVFAAVAPGTMVFVAGTHMQLLPVFPGLLAWAELVRGCSDRRSVRLVGAGGWAAWQFAASPYLAFFWFIITAAIAPLWWLIRRGAPATQSVETLPPRAGEWGRSIALAVLGGTLLLLAVVAYVRARHSGLDRLVAEVARGTPIWRSWLTAPPNLLLYPAGWPAAQAGVEHSWFTGFLPWIALMPALWFGWKRRRERAARWMFALAGGAVLTAIFFTKTSESGSGLWLAIASRVGALHAFRETTRVAVLLHVIEIGAAALLLSQLRTWFPRLKAGVPILLAALLAFEGVASRQPVARLAEARARSDAMIAAWRAAGDRPVLAYAFGFTNNTDALFHLDAWSAALRLKKSTLNGFTGGIPGSHHRFIWSPTVENARALIAAEGIDPAQVSIVTELLPQDARVLGIVRQEQRPLEPLIDFDLQPVAWKLFAPLERWTVEGATMYQFTPDAEVRFRLPDAAREIDYLVAFRPDAYTGGGKSDGCGVTWSVQAAGQPERQISPELLTPLTRPEHRGLLPRRIAIPPGRDRVLILRTDTGPAHDLPWDFLLFGRLRVK